MWIRRFYLPHQYPKTEQWLADMASNGLRLIEHRCFRFDFEQCEPRVRGFLFMYGSSRENNILSTVRMLKSNIHAQEIPGRRFMALTLMMLPDPDKLADVPELMRERRREHVKYFLQWAAGWFVILSPLQVAICAMDSPLRWLVHALFTIPALMYFYAACMEVLRR